MKTWMWVLFVVFVIGAPITSGEAAGQDYWEKPSTRFRPQSLLNQDRAINLSLAPREKAPDSTIKMPAPVDGQTKPARSFKPIFLQSNGVCYRPLLFEEPALERNGVTRPEVAQNVVSGAKFFSRGVLLPFNWLRRR